MSILITISILYSIGFISVFIWGIFDLKKNLRMTYGESSLLSFVLSIFWFIALGNIIWTKIRKKVMKK